MFIGATNGNRDLLNGEFGTAGGNRQITEGWVGTASGNRQFYALANNITYNIIGTDIYQMQDDGFVPVNSAIPGEGVRLFIPWVDGAVLATITVDGAPVGYSDHYEYETGMYFDFTMPNRDIVITIDYGTARILISKRGGINVRITGNVAGVAGQYVEFWVDRSGQDVDCVFVNGDKPEMTGSNYGGHRYDYLMPSGRLYIEAYAIDYNYYPLEMPALSDEPDTSEGMAVWSFPTAQEHLDTSRIYLMRGKLQHMYSPHAMEFLIPQNNFTSVYWYRPFLQEGDETEVRWSRTTEHFRLIDHSAINNNGAWRVVDIEILLTGE